MPSRFLPEIPFDQGFVRLAARLGQTLGCGGIGDNLHLDTVLSTADLGAVERTGADLLMDALGIDADEPRRLLRGKRIGQRLP